jgi:hypothetical protein
MALTLGSTSAKATRSPGEMHACLAECGSDARESTEELRDYLGSVSGRDWPALLAVVRRREDWPARRLEGGRVHAGATLDRLGSVLRDLL